MVSFDQALEIVTAGVFPLDRERVSLAELAGRTLAESVVAPSDLPAFDRSAVDGYGVRAFEGTRARIVVGELAAGQDPGSLVVRSGEAVRLFTGSAVPQGVDAIVMQEDAAREDDLLYLDTPPKSGNHIRRRGGEARAGDLVFDSGTAVTPPVISLLATLGLAQATVWRRPTVKIVATGSELASPGSSLLPGQVYESIVPGLRAAVEGAGGIVLSDALVRDDPEATHLAFEAALDADVVLTCGGVSVGDHDLVRPTLASLGVETRIWGVAMRPGKPFYYGLGPEGRRIFGLPGNPLSALVTFHVLVLPVLARLQGHAARGSARIPLDVPEGLPQVGERDSFLCALSHEGGVRIERAQESHMLSGLAKANALVRLPARSGPYMHGDIVEVIPIEWA